MIKVTRTKSGMNIVTVKACGLYANVSFGKSAKPAAKGWSVPAHAAGWQISKLATKKERALAEAYAVKCSQIVAEKDPKNYEGNFHAYEAAYYYELRRLIENRKNSGRGRWLQFMAADAFGMASCAVLAFSAFLSF